MNSGDSVKASFDPTDGNRLLEPLQALATAHSKAELHNILSHYPDLLSEWVDDVLTQLVQAAWQRRQIDSLCIFLACRAFLAQCRQQGVERALAEQQSLPVAASSPLVELIQPPEDDAAILRRISLYPRAIGQTRRETEPELWATLHYELADYLALSQDQDRAQKLEETIRCYQAVLEVWTRDRFPQKWAQVLHDKASAFRYRVCGDRGENLRRAIKLYKLALQVRTLETYPEEWAETQTCLGIAWKDLPDGNRRANQACALEHYQAALEVWSRKTNPVGWARLQHNLGNLCNQYVGGDRVNNLECALKHYRLALKIRSRDTDPVAWATTQVAMANTYVECIHGDRAENLERAIELYQEALDVQTRETQPAAWAETQYNLAYTYRMRIRGDRAENQEQAIKHYRLALQVHTRQAFPIRWATDQTDMGRVYYRRLYGDRAENLEQAIDLFKQALEVRKRDTLPEQWAATQLNLANVYCDRIKGNKAENLEQAIKRFNLALGVRTREDFPYEWAMLKNNLGTAYWERIKGNQVHNIEKAIQLFNKALEVHTPDTLPVDARRAARNLGNLFFGEGRWAEAHAAYTIALQAAKNLYTAAFTEAGRDAEISENATLYAHDAFCLAHMGQSKQILIRLEEGKTRTLSERLGRDAVQLQRAKPGDQKKYRELLNTLKGLEREQRVGNDTQSLDQGRRPYTEIAAEVKQAHQKLNALTQRIRDYLPDFLPAPLDFAAIQALVPDEQTALVEFCVTEKGSMILVVQSDDEPETVWMKGFTQVGLRGIVRDWVVAYLSQDFVRWQQTIERVLRELGRGLVTPLHKMLKKKGITRLILVPQGSLFLLPLHAVTFGQNGACLLDHYEVSYAPSATVLQRCRERVKSRQSQKFFGVANPTGDFAYAGSEIQTIETFSKEAEILWRDEATKDKILKQCKGYNYVHFCCHGRYDWNDPFRSVLMLAGSLTKNEVGQQTVNYKHALTLTEVETGLDLKQTRLITLPACETGLTEATGPRAEEYVGLPAGFLLAGAPAVVAPLWEVYEVSTTLLMERFYENHLRGDPEEPNTKSPLPPAEALRRAQIWLRDKLTVQEVVRRCEERIEELKDRGEIVPQWLSKALRRYWQMSIKKPECHPFAHPYYWAAFVLYGAADGPERKIGDNYV